VKRVRNNPRVTLQPCDVRGRVKAGAAVVEATAEVLLGDAAKPVHDAIRRRHFLFTRLMAVGDLFRRLGRRSDAPECAILLRFEP